MRNAVMEAARRQRYPAQLPANALDAYSMPTWATGPTTGPGMTREQMIAATGAIAPTARDDAIGNVLTSMIPVAGDIRDAWEFGYGRDIAGHPLNAIDRILTGGAAALPLIGGALTREAADILRKRIGKINKYGVPTEAYEAPEYDNLISRLVGELPENAPETAENISDIVRKNMEFHWRPTKKVYVNAGAKEMETVDQGVKSWRHGNMHRSLSFLPESDYNKFMDEIAGEFPQEVKYAGYMYDDMGGKIDPITVRRKQAEELVATVFDHPIDFDFRYFKKKASGGSVAQTLQAVKDAIRKRYDFKTGFEKETTGSIREIIERGVKTPDEIAGRFDELRLELQEAAKTIAVDPGQSHSKWIDREFSKRAAALVRSWL